MKMRRTGNESKVSWFDDTKTDHADLRVRTTLDDGQNQELSQGVLLLLGLDVQPILRVETHPGATFGKFA